MARKFEIHCHTADIDPVSEMTPELLVDSYMAKGYDGIVVTNHYFHTLYEWYPELNGASNEAFLEKYLRGYREVKAYGESRGITVLPGTEVRFDGNPSDYLVYGLTEDWFYEHPGLNFMNLDDFLKILPKDALVVQAHPFRDNMKITPPCKLFGVEVYNGRTKPDRNAVADFWADTENLRKTAGSDCHKRFDIAKGGIVFTEDVTDASSFVAALKSGNYRLIKDGEEQN